jgi:hypothetical protein
MSFLKKLERKVLRPVGRIIKKAVSWITGLQEFDASDFDRGYLLNKQSNVEPIPVIYGERKVGGTRVFVATSGTNNQFLYVVLVLCEGEINQIGDVYINDIISTDAKYTGKVIITKYVGTDSQTADATLTAAGIGWTSNHRLRGLAYLAMRFTYDQDTFGGGIPDVTCIVQGKKCFDPRTSTTIYTRNPAVCLRDYLVNTRYGKGLSSGLIDDASFIAAANKCDAAVAKYTGASGTEPIFNLNAVIGTGETLFDNVKVFLASMRGIFPFSDGKYSLVMEDDYSPTFDFTLDNVLSDIRVVSLPKSQQYNRVTAKFTNPLANWQLDSVTWPAAGSSDYTNFLTADNGVELVGEINLPGTTDYYSARDLARVFCLDSRSAKLSVDFVSTSEALKCAIGDVVTLTHPSMGWVSKRFRVTDLTLLDTGDVGVGLKEHVPTIYPWVVSSEAPAFAQSTLPNPLEVAAPTEFVITETTYISADGTVIPEITVEWTGADDAFVEQYELQFKISTAVEFYSVFTTVPRYSATHPEVGQTYDIQVRAINGIGVRSDWLASSYTILGDATAPEKPTGVTITGSASEAVINWDACIAPDYKETIIYASLTNDPATAVEQGRTSGTQILYTNLPENTTYYVWLKHSDFSGNLSIFSDVQSFNTSRGEVSAPTSLVVTLDSFVSPTGDGTAIPIVRISWTAPAQPVQYYEFEYKETTLSSWQSVSVPTTFFEAPNAKVGVAYDVRVRAVNENFGKSAYLTGTFTPIPDNVAPEKPTGLAISGSYNEAIVSWNACIAPDYKETILYASSTNNFASAVEQGRVSGTSATYYDLPLSTTYYVWVKHVDFSGNLSIVSDVATFTTTAGLASEALAPNAVTEVKIAANAVTNTKIINGAVTNAKLDANAVAANVFAAGVQPIGIFASVPGTKSTDTIFVTSTAKIYRWNGSAYIATVATGDLTGQVTTAQIVDGAITNALLGLGAVSTEKIAVNAVTASRIFVTDTSSLYLDYDILDEPLYTRISEAGAFQFVNNPDTLGGRRYLQINNSATLDEVATPWQHIQPAIQYRGFGRVSTSGTGGASATLFVELASISSTGDITISRRITLGTLTGSSTFSPFAADVVPYDGTPLTEGGDPTVIERRFRFVLAKSANNTNSRSARFTGLALRRKSNGELIVDGSITATKIAATDVITQTAQISDAIITSAKISDLAADKITAGTINAAITTTNILQLSTAGKIYTAGKTSAASTTSGVFLGHDGGSNYDFAVGSSTKSIVYDGSAGTFVVTGVDINTSGQVKATGSTAESGFGSYAIVGAPTTGTVSGVLGYSTGTGGAVGVQGYSVNSHGGYFHNAAATDEALYVTSTGTATYKARIIGNTILAGTTTNLVIGNGTNTGNNNLIIKNGGAGGRLDDQIIIHSQNSGGSKSTLHLIMGEGVVAGTGPLAGVTDQIKIRINAVEYWLPVVAV